MSQKLTLVFSALSLAMSTSSLAVIGLSLRRAAKALQEPRVTKGELVFEHPKAELAVKMPGGVTRYVCSDGTMRDEGGSNEPGVPVADVIPFSRKWR